MAKIWNFSENRNNFEWFLDFDHGRQNNFCNIGRARYWLDSQRKNRSQRLSQKIAVVCGIFRDNGAKRLNFLKLQYCWFPPNIPRCVEYLEILVQKILKLQYCSLRSNIPRRSWKVIEWKTGFSWKYLRCQNRIRNVFMIDMHFFAI